MLEGLDEELEILRKQQATVEATLDESNLRAEDAAMAAQFNCKAKGPNATCIPPASGPAHGPQHELPGTNLAPNGGPAAAVTPYGPTPPLESMDVDA